MEETKNISTILLDAMRARNVTIEKLAQMTGISDRFLENLIEEKFEQLPAYPYVHGYIAKIAGTLGLDSEKLWNEYLRYIHAIKRSGEKDILPSNRFASSPVLDKRIIVGSVISILIIGAVAFNLYRYFRIPKFVLENIAETTIVQTNMFMLKGIIDSRARLTLNDEEIYPDENGSFEKNLTLYPGFNTLNFTVKKFLGKEYTITKQIFYEISTSTEKISEEKNTILSPTNFQF